MPWRVPYSISGKTQRHKEIQKNLDWKDEFYDSEGGKWEIAKGEEEHVGGFTMLQAKDVSADRYAAEGDMTAISRTVAVMGQLR